LTVVAENSSQILAQLQSVDRRMQSRAVRRATSRVGDLVLRQAKQDARAVKRTGFTSRSLKKTSKIRKGVMTVKVGQERQRKFKAPKKAVRNGNNLSQIQRAGKPVPIHWIEEGTKPHIIKAKPGKLIVFSVKTGKGKRKRRRLVFARSVRSKGMRPRRLLATVARKTKNQAAQIWLSEVSAVLNGP
jgi:hypothetical protein